MTHLFQDTLHSVHLVGRLEFLQDFCRGPRLHCIQILGGQRIIHRHKRPLGLTRGHRVVQAQRILKPLVAEQPVGFTLLVREALPLGFERFAVFRELGISAGDLTFAVGNFALAAIELSDGRVKCLLNEVDLLRRRPARMLGQQVLHPLRRRRRPFRRRLGGRRRGLGRRKHRLA